MIIVNSVNKEKRYMQQQKVLYNSIKKNDTHRCIFEVTDSDRVTSTHNRALLMKRVMCDNSDIVCWLDADMLLRGSLKNIEKKIKPNTMAILYRPECSNECKFNTGTMILGCSIETQELLSLWIIKQKGKTKWFSDQKSLWKVYCQLKDTIDLLPLDKKYNDCHFNKESIIWHGKGNSTNKYYGWHEEWNKYARSAG